MSTVDAYWHDMVTVALLGTDRRESPVPPDGGLADLAADQPEPTASQRLLQQGAAATVVRRILHVLLATRDLGWPGPDAPLSVRRVAAADVFFDATQTVLGDDDWKGPDGVEFALLRVLAGRICRIAPLPAPANRSQIRRAKSRLASFGWRLSSSSSPSNSSQ